MPKAVYQQAFLEPFDSERMLKLAMDLWYLVLYFMECRKPREITIQQCDEAYLCHRYVPDTQGIELIEDSEFGESDIYDNMNLMSIRQALALMPRDQSWLTVASREDDTDELVRAIQDQQMFMHKRARTRRNMQRHLKQKNVRGRSGLYWEWREEVVWRRITDVADNAVQLKNWLKRAGMKKKDADKFTNGRYPHVISSGPAIYPIDWYDLWLDPAADIVNHRRPTKILRRFRILEDLLAERDSMTDKPRYNQEQLKKIQPWTLEQLYSNRDMAGGRMATQRLFGTMPLRMDSRLKYLPVFIIYVPHFEFDYNGTKEHFWDTYFHLVLDGTGNKPQLIFAEENPSDLGHSHILIDDAVDWFTPWASGGLGLVEKQLSKYHQKNLLQLLMVTAAAHSVFPAQLVAAGAFRDDDQISFAPGAINLVQESPFGLNAIKPVEAPAGGSQLGEQLLRFYADEMRAASGIDGLAADNAARVLTKPRTATEINANNSSGSLMLDNQAENDAELLTDLCQAIFEESQKRILPNRDGELEYERYLGDKVQQGKLSIADFRKPRSIQVLGVSGAVNRQQEMANLLQGLDIASRVAAVWPGAVPFLQIGMVNAWKKLNIQMPDQLENAPVPPPQMMPPADGAQPPGAPGAPPQGQPNQGQPQDDGQGAQQAPQMDPVQMQHFIRGVIDGINNSGGAQGSPQIAA